MSNKKTNSGTGFAGLLTILFIALKLTNVIAWSWWWVLSPIWIAFAVAFVCAIVATAIKMRKNNEL